MDTRRHPARLRAMSVGLSAALVAGGCGDRPQAGGRPADHPAFDGAAALALVERQVAFGPRVPGAGGHAAQLAWMVALLDSLGLDVEVDAFTHVTAAGDTLALSNVLARVRPEATRRILLLTHWDTRPRAEMAADSARRGEPIPGANDGGSGTAVLLELARMFASAPPPMGIDLLFVDGEDYGPGVEDMFLGSTRYAARLPAEGRPVYGVLLDMVGDADPEFPVEGYSAELASIVVRKVWGAARRLGYADVFPERVGQRVGDDHLPLLQAGLPTADVVDLSYGPGNAWWHTPEDTPDKLSARTLGIVGEVLGELVYSGG